MRRGIQQLVGLLFALTAPISGARASCAAPQSCVCETLPTQHVLRGRVASFEGARATVEVDEVLAERVQSGVTPGTTLAGTVPDASPCEMPETSFAPGDEVLALWEGPAHSQLLDDCEAYAACSYEQCDKSGTPGTQGGPDSACHRSCLEASAEACPGVVYGSRLVLIAWQEELDLGQGRKLPASEAGLLGNRESCVTRYPAPPPPACDDVVRVPVYEGCSATGHNGAANATWCVLLLLLWAARRRVPR